MSKKLKIKQYKTRVHESSILRVAVFCSKKIGMPLGRSTQKSQGFTLIEMLMVLAIVAILMSMAVPRYEQFVAQQDVKRTTQQLRDHLELARTYAQTHQTSVQLCPVVAANINETIPTCGAVDAWGAWMVAAVDKRGVVNQVLARSEPILSRIQITSGQRGFIKLNAQGGADGSNDTLTITSTQQPSIDRHLTVAPNGRTKECEISAPCP